MTSPAITVLTKAPVPGRVKTRLAPALGADGAARLHRAFVDATIERVARTGLPFGVAVGADSGGHFSAELTAAGHTVVQQAHGDLGDRMQAALQGTGRRIVTGTDCVVFDPSWLIRAATSHADVAIAPSEDGGYWALSVEGRAPAWMLDTLFRSMPWSTPEVLSVTLERCARAGLTVDLLPTCYDIDLPSDLPRLLHDPRCPPRVRALLESFPCLS